MASKISAADIDTIRLREQGITPDTPASGYGSLYCRADGIYFIGDNGIAIGPFGLGMEPGGRLTLETGVPVSISDQSAKTTLYYTPYKHNMIALYNGARWNPVPFTEKSISLAGYTASRVYDIFGYLAAGTLALESLIWTDATNRATALAYQDGVLIKSGDTTRRYLGTICINSAGGQTEDTRTQRFVWNYHNRAIRRMYYNDLAGSWAYTGAWRQANNTTAAKVEFVQGVVEDSIPCTLVAIRAVTDDNSFSAIGLDANGIYAACTGGMGYSAGDNQGANVVHAEVLVASPGYHDLRWLEKSTYNTPTWYGVNGDVKSGISATILG